MRSRSVAGPALLLLALALAACGPRAAPPVAAVDGGPFSVILYIVDGAGVAHWSAAQLGTSELAVESFPVMGLVDVASANSRVTDSAASATAYAAGVRTFNNAIGLAADSTPVRTVLQLAASRGMGTGLVVSCAVTHATPAAFAAHVPHRQMYWEIARQMAERDIDVLLGGGRRYFDAGIRADSLDLLERLARGSAYVETAEALFDLDLDRTGSVVGLFWENHPGAAPGRSPSLPDMTEAALHVLERQRRGFFLMVEGAQVDWRGHENAPLHEVVVEMIDFDMAIRRGVAFRERRPNTLIVVVSDHATGGLALHGDTANVFSAHYTTMGHTAELVPLFAVGPGASLFSGFTTNDAVGRLLLELVAAGGPDGIRPRARTGAAPWTPSSR